MKRAKKPAALKQPAQERKLLPNENTLQQIADMPEAMKCMALAYMQGLETGRKLNDNRARA